MAARVLAQIAERGHEGTIVTLAACLTDRDADVRGAAVQGLSQIAPKGSELAIRVIASELEHQEVYVRCAAVKALAEVAEKGDDYAIQMCQARLRHGDVNVRRAAQDALDMVNLPKEATIKEVRVGVEDLDSDSPTSEKERPASQKSLDRTLDRREAS